MIGSLGEELKKPTPNRWDLDYDDDLEFLLIILNC